MCMAFTLWEMCVPYFVYILRSVSTGKVYIGQTDNLDRRVEQHTDFNFNLTLYTKRNKGPWQLIHSGEFETTRGESRKTLAVAVGAAKLVLVAFIFWPGRRAHHEHSEIGDTGRVNGMLLSAPILAKNIYRLRSWPRYAASS